MIENQLFVSFFLLIAISNGSMSNENRFFEYELPNRTITICPSYSLISLECPQIGSSYHHQSNEPKYLISIDYIRSYPLRLGFDPRSCQPDYSHGCNNYDLRYINSLCNGQSHCSDISTYQIRERSLCAFKAVTEIGFHCVPTWNLLEIEHKYDLCENISLSSSYGFVYSRNYPLKTSRTSCFIKLSSKFNEKLIVYFVNGDLNHDQLRFESITLDHQTIANVTLNGNLTTQRITETNYQMKISFLPSEIYSYHPTYFLLYFYTIPICSANQPCPSTPIFPMTQPPIWPTTSRIRIQSIGWTKVQNIWIVIPIVLAYILLVFVLIILALLLQRRRKQKKILENIGKSELLSHVQLVRPGSYPHHGNPLMADNSFAQNFERYSRSSRSEFDLPQASMRPSISNENLPTSSQFRRSLPKSFSDCDLCKKRVLKEEFDERPPTTTTVEYSTVLPRHQRMASDPNHQQPVRHLPFEYIPNDRSNFHEDYAVKFYNNHNQDYLHDPREVQQMSMKINDKHQYFHQ